MNIREVIIVFIVFYFLGVMSGYILHIYKGQRPRVTWKGTGIELEYRGEYWELPKGVNLE
jgi:hypothetical protein